MTDTSPSSLPRRLASAWRKLEAPVRRSGVAFAAVERVLFVGFTFALFEAIKQGLDVSGLVQSMSPAYGIGVGAHRR